MLARVLTGDPDGDISLWLDNPSLGYSNNSTDLSTKTNGMFHHPSNTRVQQGVTFGNNPIQQAPNDSNRPSDSPSFLQNKFTGAEPIEAFAKVASHPLLAGTPANNIDPGLSGRQTSQSTASQGQGQSFVGRRKPTQRLSSSITYNENGTFTYTKANLGPTHRVVKSSRPKPPQRIPCRPSKSSQPEESTGAEEKAQQKQLGNKTKQSEYQGRLTQSWDRLLVVIPKEMVEASRKGGKNKSVRGELGLNQRCELAIKRINDLGKENKKLEMGNAILCHQVKLAQSQQEWARQGRAFPTGPI
jgi:hypothetical protein